MRAIFTNGPINLEYVEKFLKKHNISFLIFMTIEGSDLEIRIDMEDMSEEEIELLDNEFSDEFEDDIRNYTFIIFWK